MKQQDLDTTKHATKVHKESHSKHMWMMAACCGLPIVGFLAIGALEINAPSFETLIALICPIAMIGMMFMMRRNSPKEGKDASCCQQEEIKTKPQENIARSEQR